MLTITSYDTSSYQEIFALLKEELVKKSGATFYDSDMEIVILELWALLLDMQNYTMDVMTVRMQKEMLCFLLGGLGKVKSAQGILFANFSSSKWLFSHTLLDQIADLPYEVVKPTYIQNNKITGCEVVQNAQRISFVKNVALSKGMRIEIILRAPMDVDKPCELYFEFANRRARPSPHYPQAIISCFYESIHGSCALPCKDETLGFLTSGRCTIYPHKQSREGGCKLCFLIEDAWYDEDPLLCNIYLNPLKVRQQKTYATSMIFPMQHQLFVCDELASKGTIYVFLYQNTCYQEISFKKIEKDEGVYICISHEYEGEHILLVLQNSEVQCLGSTNGQSTQRIALPYQDIETVQLMMKQSDGWYIVDVFDSDTYQKEQLYGAWYHAQEGYLQFGCGKDFLIPQKGEDNLIFTTLLISKGKKGNIKKDILTSAHFTQCFPMQGGEDNETLEQARARITTDLTQYPTLCASDIEKVAQSFPGNAITYLRCIPQKYLPSQLGKKGYMLMIGASNQLSKRYLDMMNHWLKKQLPFGVVVECRQAEQYPVSIRLQAAWMRKDEETIRQIIKTWVMNKSHKEIILSDDLISHLQLHSIIKDIRECCFIIGNNIVHQLQIPYHTFVVVAKIHLSNNH